MNRYILTSHFSEEGLPLRPRHGWIAECVHNDIVGALRTFFVHNIRIFVVNEVEIHQVATKASQVCYWMAEVSLMLTTAYSTR